MGADHARPKTARITPIDRRSANTDATEADLRASATRPRPIRCPKSKPKSRPGPLTFIGRPKRSSDARLRDARNQAIAQAPLDVAASVACMASSRALGCRLRRLTLSRVMMGHPGGGDRRLDWSRVEGPRARLAKEERRGRSSAQAGGRESWRFGGCSGVDRDAGAAGARRSGRWSSSTGCRCPTRCSAVTTRWI